MKVKKLMEDAEYQLWSNQHYQPKQCTYDALFRTTRLISDIRIYTTHDLSLHFFCVVVFFFLYAVDLSFHYPVCCHDFQERGKLPLIGEKLMTFKTRSHDIVLLRDNSI